MLDKYNNLKVLKKIPFYIGTIHPTGYPLSVPGYLVLALLIININAKPFRIICKGALAIDFDMWITSLVHFLRKL